MTSVSLESSFQGLRARSTEALFRFARPATTSRGTLFEKRVRYVFLRREAAAGIEGVGEVSLFPGLSADDRPDFDTALTDIIAIINSGDWPSAGLLAAWPSIAFALETALADLENGGRRLLYPSAFTDGAAAIPINGLVWMGSLDDMLGQVRKKLDEGFRCLKLKIGSSRAKRDDAPRAGEARPRGGGGSDRAAPRSDSDAGGDAAAPDGPGIDEELSILAGLRARFSPADLELRVDANGAFSPAEAPEILERLAALGIHSIEQPIRAGQREEMAALCAASPLPIALDEELIGVAGKDAKRRLLSEIRPRYLILKPGLLGGLRACDEWIGLARELGVGWWATSALETSVGLNAIAQWTYATGNRLRQGLSTGRIFTETIPSPLELRGERLFHDPRRGWDLSMIDHDN